MSTSADGFVISQRHTYWLRFRLNPARPINRVRRSLRCLITIGGTIFAFSPSFRWHCDGPKMSWISSVSWLTLSKRRRAERLVHVVAEAGKRGVFVIWLQLERDDIRFERQTVLKAEVMPLSVKLQRHVAQTAECLISLIFVGRLHFTCASFDAALLFDWSFGLGTARAAQELNSCWSGASRVKLKLRAADFPRRREEKHHIHGPNNSALQLIAALKYLDPSRY